MIEIKDLSKIYGTQKAVDGISFQVEKGEIVGFLGPNGAGKSTTMKIVTCYMPPTSGEVFVDGMAVQDKSIEVRRMIGYLPEQNPLYFEMNVLDFLKYAAELRDVPKERRTARVKDVVELCSLGEVLHKDIGQLSKGFKQRTGLAQAMVHDPAILILDEPTIGLDPNQLVDIRNLIKQLGKEKTVVLSTHILSEVQATCDRAVIIRKGKIVADAKLEDLQRSASQFDTLQLELLTPDIKIREKLLEIDGILDVREGYSKNGAKNFTLKSSTNSDPRERIFNTAVANKWVIIGLTREAHSLEKIFKELTTDTN